MKPANFPRRREARRIAAAARTESGNAYVLANGQRIRNPKYVSVTAAEVAHQAEHLRSVRTKKKDTPARKAARMRGGRTGF